MTLDLRLLPCEVWIDRDGRLWGFAHSILELGSVGEDAWAAFQVAVKPHLAELPADHSVTSFVGALVSEGRYEGERIYGEFRAKDAYGEAYQAVAARHLLPWIEKHFRYSGDRGRGGPYQTAIVAYVRALPPDTKIVLDWH